MSDNTNSSITIYSYQKVWGFEKLVYRVLNIQLPVPVSETDVWYGLGGLLAVSAIRSVLPIPLTSTIASLAYYIGIPLAIIMLMRYKTFDGKNPLAFACDYLRYIATDRLVQLEFFVPVHDEPTHIARWQLGYRHRLRLPRQPTISPRERRQPRNGEHRGTMSDNLL